MNKRWFTCTPVHFRGDQTFFARDSGLLCRGFQALGIESRAVMREPRLPDDEPDLIRAELVEMESAEWWRGHDLDGVVLYSWASPRFNAVAKAISDSGCRLVVNMDTEGLISPWIDSSDYFDLFWRSIKWSNTPWKAGVRGVGYLLYGICPWIVDVPRVKHLAFADITGVVSSLGAERIAKYLKFFGREDLAERVRVIPHPVSPAMSYNGTTKEKAIIAIGRWDAIAHKNGPLLLQALNLALQKHPDYVAWIIGGGENVLAPIINGFSKDISGRIQLLGPRSHHELPQWLSRSQILACSSNYESFHIASGEALCCGCSLVGPGLRSAPAILDFVAQGHGTNCAHYSVHGMADAIDAEITNWQEGKRNPFDISAIWCAKLHSQNVVQKILNCVPV